MDAIVVSGRKEWMRDEWTQNSADRITQINSLQQYAIPFLSSKQKTNLPHTWNQSDGKVISEQ